MDYRKITAIFPELALEGVEERLQELGVPGVTVTKVKGYGAYRDYVTDDQMVCCAKVEIFIPASKAGEIANGIMDAVHTGMLSDGIVAVHPVESLYRIRQWPDIKA